MCFCFVRCQHINLTKILVDELYSCAAAGQCHTRATMNGRGTSFKKLYDVLQNINKCRLKVNVLIPFYMINTLKAEF